MSVFNRSCIVYVIYCIIILQVCCHGGYDYDISNPEIHEDKPPYNLESICQYVRDHLPGLEANPSIIQKCKYTASIKSFSELLERP